MSALGPATRRVRLGARRIELRAPRLRLSRQRIRLSAALSVLLLLILGGGWFLLRDSPLVSVDHVTVTGASGADAGDIRAALDAAARRMTTLDVSDSRLQAAVSGFPEVRGLRVSSQFPHGLVIHVVELLPVGAVRVAGGREVPVTGDGTLLPNVPVAGSLPLIALEQPAGQSVLGRRWALSAAQLLAGAPRRMLSRLAEVTTVSGHGLVVQLRNGPSIYFGDGGRLQAKWAAALAVLADPGSAGALYIDVTDPARPAAGSGQAAAVAAGATSYGTSTTGASSSSSAAPAPGSSSPSSGGGSTSSTPSAGG